MKKQPEQVLTREMMEATAKGHQDDDIHGEPVILRTWEGRKAYVEFCWERAGLEYSEELHLRCLKAFRDPAWFLGKDTEVH